MIPLARFASSVLILFFVCSANAQSPTGWETLVTDDGDLSVQVPSGYIAHKEAAFVKVYYRADGVSGSVQREKADAKQRLSWIRPIRDDKSIYRPFEFEGFSMIRNSSEPGSPAYTETVYIAAGGRFFTISAHGKDRNDPNLRRVLDSIRIKGRLLAQDGAPVADGSVMETNELTKLKNSPEVEDALKRPHAPLKVAYFEKFDRTKVTDIRSRVYTRQLVILRKERASYTDSARAAKIRGTVTARVLFRADGTIGEIAIDPTLDKGLAASAADAARRIKFLPAEIDGKPIDEWRPVSFSFDIG